MHRNGNTLGCMKTATLPPIRIAPYFRSEIEDVLESGETLSKFVEHAVRATVILRKSQAEFVQRGLAAIERTQAHGNGVPASAVVATLEARLAAARLAKRP